MGTRFVGNRASLCRTRERRLALSILESGLAACTPRAVVRRHVSLSGGELRIRGKRYLLSDYRRIVLIGFGKMAAGVARELERILSIERGVVISPEKACLRRVTALAGTHPLPSLQNVRATRRLLRLVGSLTGEDLVLCVVSGGGSALLCAPSMPFTTYLKELRKRIFSGMDIAALNRWRTRHSLVKGGRLAKLIFPAKLVNLIFSDVIGDDPRTIASGPTYSPRADNHILLTGRKAVEAMAAKARSLGLRPRIRQRPVRGEASRAGAMLAQAARRMRAGCLIAGGETTVRVRGKGRGGRNQELCLGALSSIRGVTLASIGSDGIDGVTDAAGAIVDEGTLGRAAALGLDARAHLRDNDSHTFLKRTGDLILTGRTGINVMDLMVAVQQRRRAGSGIP